MHYKIEGTRSRNKNRFIVFAILWLFMTIVIVMPISYGIHIGNASGTFDFAAFLDGFVNSYSKLGTVVGSIGQYFKEFFGLLWKFTAIYVIFMFIGFVRTSPKNEFTDIEQGSSDWASKGEQYKVLSNKKGIILAENNYLPTDKRGNVNILVVGRIWFW